MENAEIRPLLANEVEKGIFIGRAFVVKGQSKLFQSIRVQIIIIEKIKSKIGNKQSVLA